jgi:hypothetical protein
MISIHSEEDLHKLNHLARKKNILARFVMNGCPWCVKSQPEWDSFSSNYSGDLALAEIESSFLQHFQQTMAPRKASIHVKGFPTILLIRASKVKTVPFLQKLKMKNTKNTKTKKTKKRKNSKRV